MGVIKKSISDQPREAVLYLLRRNSCQCLRNIYEQLKANGKKGVCSSTVCEAQKERKQLRVCSGCNVAQYCSSECQKQHWQMHKVVCGGKMV